MTAKTTHDGRKRTTSTREKHHDWIDSDMTLNIALDGAGGRGSLT